MAEHLAINNSYVIEDKLEELRNAYREIVDELIAERQQNSNEQQSL